MSKILKLIRTEQWAKNFLIFLVPLAAKNFEISIYFDLVFVFIGFSFLASSGYIVNDIFDLESDRYHYIKKNRVLASGKISVKSSKIIIFILFFLGSTILIAVNNQLLLYSYIYLLVSILYSKYLKYIKFLDVSIISIFFIFRTYLGSLSSGINISIYLLLIVLFSSLAIVIGKKLSILLDNNIHEIGVKKSIKTNYSIKFLSNALITSFIFTLITYNLWTFKNFNISSYIFIFSNILLIIFCKKFYNLTLQSKTEDFISTLKNNEILLLSFTFFILLTLFGILF